MQLQVKVKIKMFTIQLLKHMFLSRVMSISLLLAGWEAAYALGLLKTTLLPPPHMVATTLWHLLCSGQLLIDAFTSLWRVFVGFSLAAIIGITLGIGVTLSRTMHQMLTPLLELIRPIPPVAFIPIAILWFGIGNAPAYFLVTLGAFFPIFTNTRIGISQVGQGHREAALCLGAGRWLLLTDVLLPGSLPYLIGGLRTGLGTAWFCVIVAEMVGAQSGLGYMIQLSRLTLQSEQVLAGMVVIGLLGLSMNYIMRIIQRAFLPWSTRPQLP